MVASGGGDSFWINEDKATCRASFCNAKYTFTVYVYRKGVHFANAFIVYYYVYVGIKATLFFWGRDEKFSAIPWMMYGL